MESDTIYQDSLQELRHIRRQFTYSDMHINLSKLDGKSKETIIYALSKAVADREKAVVQLLSGVS